MLFELRTYVMTETMAEDIIFWQVEYPKNWVQAIKERFFPGWLKTIFPVSYKVEKFKKKISAVALYPDLPEVFSGQVGKIVIRTFIDTIE